MSFFAIYIVPLLSPGDNNGTIYIATIFRNETNYMIMLGKGKFPREEGFLRGAFISEKWGLEMFWGVCLKICVY